MNATAAHERHVLLEGLRDEANRLGNDAAELEKTGRHSEAHDARISAAEMRLLVTVLKKENRHAS